MLANGHDGKFSLHGLGTTIRVWCDNTLNAAMKEGRKSNNLISIRHKGNMSSKIEDLVTALRVVNKQTEDLKEASNAMARYQMTSKNVNNYWDDVYARFIDTIPNTVQTKEELRQHNRWTSVKMKFWDVFDKEASALGSNLWTAFNAITNHIDHNTVYRGDNGNKAKNKFYGNIYGNAASKKKQILLHSLDSMR